MLKKFILPGHSLNDYVEMFDLTPAQLSDIKFLDFCSGATTFNLEMTQLGHRVISADPLYAMSPEEMNTLVTEAMEMTIEKMKDNQSNYNWKDHGELEDLIHVRKKGIEAFIGDLPEGTRNGRYIGVDESETLPFENFTFDIALMTHHLFVNFEDKGVEEHVATIGEMVRVASEARIFPLLDKYGQVSKLLGPVMLELQQRQFGVEVRQVTSKLQKAGNAMLRVWATECVVDNS